MEDAENRKEKCGRGIEYRRMWIDRKNDGKLYIGYEFIENGKSCCANPLTFRATVIYETDDRTALCTISDEMATKLMDDLWKAGIRPTEQEENS